MTVGEFVGLRSRLGCFDLDSGQHVGRRRRRRGKNTPIDTHNWSG